MINFLADWTFDKPLVNNGTGTNKGIDITVERFLKDGYYFMSTASIYDSRYTGGDGVEHKTRYDGGHIFNLLGGKEWKIRDKNLFGINIKITLMGPYWHYPVDKDASHLEGDIVYDETQPFNYRHSDLESINDMTATYRINGKNRSAVIAIQVKNLIGRQYQGKQYHLASRKIENDFFSSPVPFVSYKLEF